MCLFPFFLKHFYIIIRYLSTFNGVTRLVCVRSWSTLFLFFATKYSISRQAGMRPKWCQNHSRVSVKYSKQYALKSVTNYNCVSAKNRLTALTWLSEKMVISCIEAKLMKTGRIPPIRLFQELTLLRSGTIAPCFRSAKNRPLGWASPDKPLISKIEDTFFKRLSIQEVSCNWVDLKVTKLQQPLK